MEKERQRMFIERKSQVKNSIGRMIFVALAVLIQVAWIVTLVMRLQKYSGVISLATSGVALLMVLHIYGTHTNAAFKMPWIMLIMAFPIMGLTLYLIFGSAWATRWMGKRFEKIDKELQPKLIQDPEVLSNLENKDMSLANQARYVWNCAKYPVYQNTDVAFFDDAEKGLEAQKEALCKAEKFIFMEYHAIEDNESFQSLKDILKEKAAMGVDVRVLYDEVGSVGFINKDFIKRMQADGIDCRVFNPLIPFLSVFMNNRDHRKITVIDGKVGFTGGYNLAEEYFNKTHPYGHWKDTGVRLEGDAVRSLTQIFLEVWNSIHQTDVDYDKLLPIIPYKAQDEGFVQPYADSPLDNERTGENVYLNVIKNAKRYVYFTTPYLIISDEMTRELGLAAKRGVDVRIITPGIPDKKVVFQLTRSYYAGLAMQGVKIYEYTPGFIHAKQCVSDDETATVGTINLDYRSLYLHFENGVLLQKMDCIKDIKKDFDRTLKKCSDVTEKYCNERSTALRMGQCILRLFAPLM